MEALPLWLRTIVGAILCAVLGWLVDAYVPLQPAAHIVAIVLYVIALIGVLYGGYLLVFGGGVYRPRA